MSLHVSSWAWKQDVGDAGAKLVLVKLADSANDNGACYPGLKRLMGECEMSRRTLQRKVTLLVQKGLVVVERQGSEYGTNLYKLGGVNLTPGGVTRDTGGVSPVTPEPSVEPKVSSSSEGAAQLDLMGGSAASPAEKRTAASVDGKQVSRQEDALAKGILAAFNRAFGKDFRGRDHYASIVMRIRERPDLTLEDHAALVEKVNAGEHWWRGSPSPKIIYGTSRALDAALNRDDAEGAGDDDGLDVYAGANV